MRPRAVVCGTKFGRVYLAALARPDSPFELAGVLGRGGERTRRCAELHGVPLYRSPGELPDDVTAACVVVSSAINGGRGAELAQRLMARGIHVLQEHPLHPEELAACLRTANAHGVRYRVNTLYPQIAPVRRFVAAARRLLRGRRPLFVDATVAFQVAYTLFDVLDHALGTVRPWSLGHVSPAVPGGVYRAVDGVLGGVPLSLRVQHHMDPSSQDNFTHLFHRITIGAEGGHLTLANTHGPVLWSPRPHMPDDLGGLADLGDADAEHLAYPSAETLGPAVAPSYREILSETWPEAVGRELRDFREAIEGSASNARVQRHLTLTRLTKEVLDALGPVELRRGAVPEVLPGAAVAPAPGGDG